MLWLMEKLFDQPVKNDKVTYRNIGKVATPISKSIAKWLL